MNDKELRGAIEALLFVSDKPITLSQFQEATGGQAGDVKSALSSVGAECDSSERGFRLKELAGGYQFVTDAAWVEIIKKFFKNTDKRRISQASLETLSIIAYRQPHTRAEIEFIRGVNVDGALKTLLEKGLIRISGRKDVPGRPILYSTTKLFLDHFGLGTLKDLPPLSEFTEKDITLPETMKAGQARHELKEEKR
jgi:segregation and condensation protein B